MPQANEDTNGAGLNAGATAVADEDTETLRRVDALGDAKLSQALREALARRSNETPQEEDGISPK